MSVDQGYLYDRRQVGRFLQEEWGVVPQASDDLTTCVRRFGLPKKSKNPRRARSEHITGARMSTQNGHEVNQFQLPNLFLLIVVGHQTAFIVCAPFIYPAVNGPLIVCCSI